jgi:predicted ATP-dependent endonuclease of OLD family
VGLKSIRIKNLLSFDDVLVNSFADITCIIGQNNTGKSNLLSLIRYFYTKLDGRQSIPPRLHSSYNPIGSISITYDLSRLRKVVSGNSSNTYFIYIFNTFFKPPNPFLLKLSDISTSNSTKEFELTLTVNNDDSVKWSTSNKEKREIIHRIFPFFYIDTRRIDLYDWGKLWSLISQLKFLNASSLDRKELIDFIDKRISEKSSSYKDYVNKISQITKTTQYDYQELVLNYVKVGLEGHTFNVDGESLQTQSDGTNSHKYIELTINLMIALTRREFVTPILYVDEPELGLHPKRNEALIERLFEVYDSFKKRKETYEKGRYRTPYPTIIFSTHSPNIVKSIVKSFPNGNEHQVLHFSKKKKGATVIRKMNTHYSDKRFLNIFNDNEARLFFSNFILFVEGATELELFRNSALQKKFPKIKKIDVYATDDVMLKSINPSFSNLAIPYLILLDGDEIVNFDISSKKAILKFKSKKIDLDKLFNGLKRTFPNSPNSIKKKDLNTILSFDKTNHPLDQHKIDFSTLKYVDLFKTINKFLLTENHYAPSTTIEGSIISDNSLVLFKKWLVYLILKESVAGCKGDLTKAIPSIKKTYNAKKQITTTFLALHGEDKQEHALSSKDTKFVKKIRIELIRYLEAKVIAYGLSDKELLIVFRLAFNGKTLTMVSVETDTYKELSASIKTAIDGISELARNFLPVKTSKTGGWVTSFLNFSVKELDKKSEKFESVFNDVFPELSAIISFVSTSIE